MEFNREYLIKRKSARAHKLGVQAYSYKACRISESTELLDGTLSHIVAFRKNDCGKYLSKEELLGILSALGMRKDGTMKMCNSLSGRAIYFSQPVEAA